MTKLLAVCYIAMLSGFAVQTPRCPIQASAGGSVALLAEILVEIVEHRGAA